MGPISPDYDDMATSGTVQEDGSTVKWADWPDDGPADWLTGLTSGTPQPGSVLLWGNVQSAATEGETTLTYYEPTSLPSVLGVICELPMASTTSTTGKEVILNGRVCILSCQAGSISGKVSSI